MEDERKEQHDSLRVELGEDVSCPNRNKDQAQDKFTGRQNYTIPKVIRKQHSRQMLRGEIDLQDEDDFLTKRIQILTLSCSSVLSCWRAHMQKCSAMAA